jgi:hypothetical protein
MSIVRQRIDEQVTRPEPGQVLGHGHAPGENQPLGLHIAPHRFTPQIVRDACIVLQEPKNAAFDPSQDLHPAIEGTGRDLVAVVEATKHELRGRQPEILPAEAYIRNGALGVVDLVTMREVDDLFAVV